MTMGSLGAFILFSPLVVPLLLLQPFVFIYELVRHLLGF
jgi:hypothetical protein